ncbi:MAG: metal ABC transporter solute-binding protein, Zn/Mn family [Gaiellaceae bacterium]
MLAPFHYAFVQRGAVELAALSIAAGLLGTWIVLRGLAFFAHGVGTAAFPGLVLADGLGFAAPLGALAAALAFGLGIEGLRRGRRSATDSLTALALVGLLATGVILASDVFHSGANVEQLLFGSLLLIGRGDVIFAAAVSAAALGAAALAGRRWVAVGFEAETARSLGLRPRSLDAVLLALVAVAVTASLSALGALLVSALFVVPAATTRLVATRVGRWQLATIALVLAEGVAGLWLAVELNVPPGAAIAVLAGGVFALVALARTVGMRAVGALGLLALLAGCGSGSGGERPVVVATTTQIGDWARIVGANAVSVHQILRPNTDPHEYEPRPADVEATTRARVVFENGDGLDAWMAKVVAQSGSPHVVVLGGRVPVKLVGEAGGSRWDPHWWHDPENAASAVQQIAAALAQALPSHAAAFHRRSRAYLARLHTLDRAIAACFASIPAGERTLVTDHDAFGYFARRYGITVLGSVLSSQTTQAQPSAGVLARLVALVRRARVRAIFPESSLSPKLVDALARETGARAGYVLYGDTLGPAGSPGATYLGMERANADAMARGFTGGAHGCP